MNIVLVTPYRLDETGGLTTILRCLHHSLNDREHNVTSLLKGDTTTVEPTDRPGWPNVYNIYLRLPFIPGAYVKGFLAFWIRAPKCLYSLAGFLRRERVDVVHITYPHAELFYFALLRAFSRWKLVVSVQGSDINRFSEQDFVSRWLVKFLLLQADSITACSQSLLDKLGTVSAKLLTKRVLIPNANPISDVTVTQPIPVELPDRFALSVGSLLHRKGHDVLIRAVALVKQMGFLVNLVIVGGGPETDNLTNLARSLGVSQQIHLAGEVEHDVVSAYYAKCLYFVLATRAEGMPLAVLEAMTFGKAVIATAVDGIPEIVTEGETGLLVPSENAELLAAALIRFETEPSLRVELATKAKAFVLEEYSWSRLTDRYIETYKAVLQGNSCLSRMKILRLSLLDAFGVKGPKRSIDKHLEGAMRWLCHAQDAVGGGGIGGIARSYSLRKNEAHQKRGWLEAYPETTGYVIPTFFDYAAFSGKFEYHERALRMAEWEAEVQMVNGAVQGGTIAFAPTPAVFNTGQVLFGWSRAFRETGKEIFRTAAGRAADFLVTAQDPDGAWRREGSKYARPGVNLYDARTAWGLIEAFRVTADPRHRDAGRRNLGFVLSQQHSNGWFPHCCLDDDQRPLLHTIAYTIEGLLESGLLLEDGRLVDAARRPADVLLSLQRNDGSLAGQFDAKWKPAARWSCLTGDAQVALCWLRLFELTRNNDYLEAARRMNRFLMTTQDLTSADPGIRGGIKGSYPIWAEYSPFEYPNWAAKFFADALMLEMKLTAKG